MCRCPQISLTMPFIHKILYITYDSCMFVTYTILFKILGLVKCFQKYVFLVSACSPVGSAPIYSAVTLRASRVRISACGPFPISPPLSLPHCFLSHTTLSYINNTKMQKKKKNSKRLYFINHSIM